MRKLATQAAGVWKTNKTKTGRPRLRRTLAMRRAKAPSKQKRAQRNAPQSAPKRRPCARIRHIPKHRLNPRPRCSQRRAHRANEGTQKNNKETSSGAKTRKAVTYAAARVHAFAKHIETQTVQTPEAQAHSCIARREPAKAHKQRNSNCLLVRAQ